MSGLLLSRTEAGKRLGVSERTIRRYCADRRIAFVELPSGIVRIEESEVARLIAAGRVEPLDEVIARVPQVSPVAQVRPMRPRRLA